jgi:hypothetical protein
MQDALIETKNYDIEEGNFCATELEKSWGYSRVGWINVQSHIWPNAPRFRKV